jgi:shikimate kinase
MSGRHLVLIGLMGVGKTTVGTVLAARLGRELIDSDIRIERLTGRTVKQILLDDGVEELRRVEADALFDALDDDQPRVIAAAAGVVLDDDNRRRLREADAEVVWLIAEATTLAPRTTSGGHRPWLDDDRVATLRQMQVDRDALYREVADRSVVVDGLTPDEVADRVLA